MDYRPVEARINRVQGDNVWMTLALREGKNREVKRILEHLGLQVNRLIRLSFGPFQLGDLEPGLVEEVQHEGAEAISSGRRSRPEAGVDFASPVREPIAPFGSPSASRRAPVRRPRPARPRRERPSASVVPRRGAGRPGPALGRRTRARVRAGRDAQAPSQRVAPTRTVRPAKMRGGDREGPAPHIRAARAAGAERPHERVGAITPARAARSSWSVW